MMVCKVKHKLKTIFLAIIVMCMAGFLTVFLAVMNPNDVLPDDNEKNTEEQAKTEKNPDSQASEKPYVTIWYSDETYRDYFEYATQQYETEYGIRINPVFVSAIDYLEQIYAANNSKSGEVETPDIYLLDSTELEAAYGYGLADINEDDDYSEENYCDTALHAVTFHGKKVAYPLAFDTAFLIYNKKYFNQAPVTFDEISAYSDKFPHEENPNISKILDFNCKGLIYNYGFVGSYLEFAGADGDEESKIKLFNQQALEALVYYQGLIQKFGITQEAAAYTDYEQAFANESIACMIGTCSSIRQIDQYAEGKSLNYNVGLYPKLTASFDTCSLSITSTLVVNYLSGKKELAAEVARYLTLENTDLIYEKLQILPAKKTDTSDERYKQIYSQYEKSRALPKLMIANDYFMQLEIVLNKVLKGEDIASLLNELNTMYMIRLQ